MVRHPFPTYERPSAGHRPSDPGKRMVGRVLTGNGITRYGERDALLQLCRQRLDGFREQRGEEVACLIVEKPAASAIAPATAARSAVR